MHSYQTRSAVLEKVLLPRYNLSFPQKSIALSGAILWNEVPVSIEKAESLDSFKHKLKAYYMKIQMDAWKQPNDKLPFSWFYRPDTY